jgi:hypothetical protein
MLLQPAVAIAYIVSDEERKRGGGILLVRQLGSSTIEYQRERERERERERDLYSLYPLHILP